MTHTEKTLKTIETLNEFLSIKSPRFVTFNYKTKGTGEISKYTILVGFNYKNHIKRDLKRIESLTPTSTEQSLLKEKIVKSLTENLVNGVSSSYKKIGYYTPIGENGSIKESVKGKVYLNGYSISKVRIEPPTNPKKRSVSSMEQLKRELKFSTLKYREFSLDMDNIGTISINKKKMEIFCNW